MEQDLYNRAKNIVKRDSYMKFYNGYWPLHLGNDASGVGLEAILLEVRGVMN